MEVLTLWQPWFWILFDVKVITAVASVATAVALPGIVPRALRIVEAAGLAEHRKAALDPASGPISGDPDRLQQIAWNLMSIAIKFTPKDGRVQVRLERVSSHVELIVSDTGEGIDASFLPYVFDRFEQADTSTTRRRGGLGLGLAIVRHLVELHGGMVVAESEGLSRGATFRVLLPVTIARRDAVDTRRLHPASRSTVLSAVGRGRLDRLRVLIVDDDAPSRELFMEVIESAGAEVRSAASAREALEELTRFSCDVLLSDIDTPGEDGYSLVQKALAFESVRGENLIAVAVTAYARAGDRVRALSAGFDWHISKPVDPVSNWSRRSWR